MKRLSWSAALVLLGCGESTAPAHQTISVVPIDVEPRPCSHLDCQTTITLESRDGDSGEILGTILLSLTGDGNHPLRLTTNDTGVVTFSWTYPTVAGRYDLEVCAVADPTGGCASFSDILQQGSDR